MRYCSRCILPDTRPGIVLGSDGVCSACAWHVEREAGIDWDERRRQFAELAAQVKTLGRPYDCVVPVSGGKDSTWQVVTCLEHGLHPLAVSWRSPARTPLGARNLANLVALGVDHVDFAINPAVERRFMLRSLERCGTPAVPMHLAIFSIPTTVALRYGAPLVVWGENSAAEYVGEGPDRDSLRLDGEWVRQYGAVHGTTAADWVSDELDERDLGPYFWPSDDELTARGIAGVFLGQYFRWDPVATAELARRHGFAASADGPRTGYYDFADVDDDFISIHHWLKWLKFGLTRTQDNLSLEIRNGRLTRPEAIELLARAGDETPHDDIEAFCRHVGITTERFFEIADRFRDLDLWSRRQDGEWVLAAPLVPDPV